MVNEILTASGLPYKEARFPDPPAETYAIYFDSAEKSGPDPVTQASTDGIPYILNHDATIELYAPMIDHDAEDKLEDAINGAGLEYIKQDWYWLKDIQRYQRIYEFSYVEKRRAK